MEKKLNEFAVGEEGIVKRIEGEGRIRRRLFDMGVTPARRSCCASSPPSATPSRSISAAMS